jgi:Cu/Ag efflux protein CusF
MNRFSAALGFVFAASLAMAGLARAQPMAGAGAAESVTVSVKIVGVDAAARILTVKDKAGDMWTFKVSKDVQNLDQVKVGDSIVVKAFEAVAISIKGPKSGPPDADAVSAAVTAAKGQLPAGAEVDSVTWQGKIKKIDMKKGTVAVLGPGGNLRTFKVNDPKNLQGLKVGDDIDLTFVEGFAIAVEPPAKKSKK